MKAWKARAVLDSSAQQEAPQPADAAEAEAEGANDEAALHEFLPPEGADAGARAPPAPASAIQCSCKQAQSSWSSAAEACTAAALLASPCENARPAATSPVLGNRWVDEAGCPLLPRLGPEQMVSMQAACSLWRQPQGSRPHSSS